MTVSLKHAFQSAKSDGADSSLVQPSNWNAEHTLTLATNKLIGRATAGTGAAEEIAIGTALSMSGGTLAVTTVPVANGGTGATSLTANNVLLGNGTSAVQVVAPSTSGNVLTSNGTTWVSQAPTATTTYALISTSNASGATSVDFTGLSSDYAEYVVVVTGLYASTNNVLVLRTSSNNGTSWDAGSTDYVWSTWQSNESTLALSSGSGSSVSMVWSTLTSSNGNYLTLRVVNAGVSRQAVIDATYGAMTSANGYQSRTVACRYSTTAVNGIRILSSTGTVTGTFKLYGIKA